MKFLLQVRFNGADKMISELPAEEQQKVTAEFEAIRRPRASSTATSSRPQAPRLDGYYICDAPDLDAATAFAARIPVARLGGTVEVRPMLER